MLLRCRYYFTTVLLTMVLGAAAGGGKGHRRQYPAIGGGTSAMVHQLHRARLINAQQEKENEFLNKGKSKCGGVVIW
nr:unnamed protein product [Callosobruchus analis]